MSWMMAAEILSRLSRLVTIVVLAAWLSLPEYGIAMLALACHELTRLLLRSGSGAVVIQCEESQLSVIAPTAGIIQWGICLSACLLQWFSAPYIAAFYDSKDLSMVLQWMAVSYLFYPIVALNVFMLNRSNRLRYFGLRSGLCVSIENLSCAIAAVAGYGAFSVAIGKIIGAVAWVLLFYFAPVQKFSLGYHHKAFIKIATLSGTIFISEGLRALRGQLDILIAGRLLTPDLLGIYSFARSAGIGLGKSLSGAFISGLYPYLCEKNRSSEIGSSLSRVYLFTIGISAVFLLQSLGAFIYIPLLFSEKWAPYSNFVSLLCLSAIPALFVDVSCCIWRAQNRAENEVVISTICLFISVITFVVVRPSSPIEFIHATLISSMCWLITLSAHIPKMFSMKIFPLKLYRSQFSKNSF
nr:oligosaccharide flippase family protein [Marinibactrum halimedae]